MNLAMVLYEFLVVVHLKEYFGNCKLDHVS